MRSPGFFVDTDGVPRSRQFDDVYGSTAGRYAQAQAVFLAGNQLPQRWLGSKQFSILELGFGLATNFMATLNAWHASTQPDQQLDYIGIEGYPLSRAELASLPLEFEAAHCANWHAELLQQWPEQPEPGFHCCYFLNGAVRLILVFHDVQKALAEIATPIDAVYLDGFAPAKNPEMFDLEALQGIKQLLTGQATLATYSVATGLCSSLTSLGFAIEKQAGFANKKSCLVARIDGSRTRSKISHHQRIAVIGAGVAGLVIAERLARQGFVIDVYEQAEHAFTGASGVPASLLHPASGSPDALEFVLQQAAFHLTVTELARIAPESMHAMPVLERRKNKAERLHACGYHIDTRQLAEKLLEHLQKADVCVHWRAPVRRIAESDDRVELLGDFATAHFDTVIIANGLGANDITITNLADNAVALPRLQCIGGQVELLRGDLPIRDQALCGAANIIPLAKNCWLLGNAFLPDQLMQQASDTVRVQLWQLANEFSPSPLPPLSELQVSSWVGNRAQSADRRPIVGAIRPRIRLSLAHGSKGYMTAFLAAEQIFCSLVGRAPAIAKRVLDAIDVSRFNGATKSKAET